jgi:UDP-GlcNAc:undecaprenyl-phosphate GlcNAc-1-phosphate transferase
MTGITSSLVISFVIALVVSLALTPLVRALAPRAGLVARPVDNRWHRRPVPLMGGVAMMLAVAVSLSISGIDLARIIPLLIYSGLMFALGSADDVWHLRPTSKLAGQMIIAAVFIAFMPPTRLTGLPIVDLLLIFVWLVGITNAFNLLDNMDGLSAGIGLLAALFSLAILVPAGQTPLALALAALAGAAAGFLFYNFQPASIFMGDGGSFFLGSMLGASMLLVSPGLNPRLASVAAIPVLILLIPIFDTTFVTLTRGLSGRSALVGGRDHTSHRLVGLGISERRAVLSMYALAAAGGAVALAVQRLGLAASMALVGLYATVLLAVAVVLGHVEAEHASGESAANEPAPLVGDLTSRFRIYEVALDLALIAVAYYTAYRIRFQEPQFSGFLPQFLVSFPIVVGCQLAALWMVGKYRQVWRSFGSGELMTILRGIASGVAGCVILMLYLYRFEGFSRGVFLLDAVGLAFLLVGSRVAIGAIDDCLRRERTRGRRVAIYGAGRAGALLLRELLQNRDLGLTPVVFIDDDRSKHRVRLDGLQIAGALSDLPDLIARLGIEEVLIGMRDLPQSQLARLLGICRDRNVTVRRMRFTLDEVDPSGRPAIRVIHHAS